VDELHSFSFLASVVLPDAGCPMTNVIEGLMAFLIFKNTSV
jgi:hypothetical protein